MKSTAPNNFPHRWFPSALFAGFSLLVLSVRAENVALIVQTPVLLLTHTPLGEARIALPPGTPIETYEIEGDWARVHRGPFSGWVALTNTSLAPAPEPASTPVPSSSPLPAPAIEEKAPACPLAEDPESHALSLGDLRPWPIIALPAGLSCYALVATICWLRLRKRCSALESDIARLKKDAPAPAPAISMRADGEEMPQQTASTIACPLCQAPLEVSSLSIGRMTCSSFKGPLHFE